ncbi:hypothetical protein SD77_2894 [Bacillus badius]|uniref:Uncharacterized protein n=1 Tax=Bacillus badius TaxID=1455 RepID=A0ABR5AR79_BACBA|nr:hypothetical protein SD77_2894 [Bacillus badius]
MKIKINDMLSKHSLFFINYPLHKRSPSLNATIYSFVLQGSPLTRS